MGGTRSISVDGFVDRLYARTRRRYVETLMVLAGVALQGFGVVHVGVDSLFVRLTLDEYLRVLLLTAACLGAASLVGALIILRVMAPARRWLRGDGGPAVGALGGSLAIDSQPGGGTRVRGRVPAAS